MEIFGLKFNDNELKKDNEKGITVAYPLCNVKVDVKNENQFENFVLEYLLDQLVTYDLLFCLINDELIYRIFVYKTGERDEENNTNKMDTMCGSPSIIESKKILQGLASWNDIVDNLAENKDEFKKVNLEKIGNKIKEMKGRC